MPSLGGDVKKTFVGWKMVTCFHFRDDKVEGEIKDLLWLISYTVENLRIFACNNITMTRIARPPELFLIKMLKASNSTVVA